MKKVSTIAIGLIAAITSVASQAQSVAKDGWYGEVGYLSMRFTDSSDISPTPKLARFVVGKNLNENLSVEGMAGMTMSKGSWSSSSSNKGDLKASMYGFALKPKFEVSSGTEVFARVGVAHTSWTDDYTNGTKTGSASSSTTKAVYGLGIQTEFAKNVYGQIDYMNYGGKDDWKSKGYTVSVGFRF